MKSYFLKSWRSLPSYMRKTIVFTVGITLIVSGLVLIVIPGPFTMPLVILGLVILAAEFAWAERLLAKARHHASKIDPRKLRKKKQ
ncbi:unannotated protein [freshwater metagenome]|uniref:Unannotated protein n=1 Tax=freshwater metagenome TaxID=449393 RepID=A0A6J6RKB1_9ZZZZ|nr:hypothetical protein [Actinomycetota bacterium]MSW15322.1 hypothetical protein [Actinomycetota bacterium]MSW98529.1 hypothetical protein [Actinomycetota bacterium]MSY82281.1 hypothetical protein [Actinomycetota bacterium]MSZ45556.1 hypothetical protein [Actinomycetota bacterium]